MERFIPNPLETKIECFFTKSNSQPALKEVPQVFDGWIDSGIAGADLFQADVHERFVMVIDSRVFAQNLAEESRSRSPWSDDQKSPGVCHVPVVRVLSNFGKQLFFALFQFSIEQRHRIAIKRWISLLTCQIGIFTHLISSCVTVRLWYKFLVLSRADGAGKIYPCDFIWFLRTC